MTHKVNEITGIAATVGPTWVTPEYDPAGNMTTIPQPKDPTQPYTAVYDVWNRLVRLTAPSAPPESSSSSSSSHSSASSASSDSTESSEFSASSASSVLNSSSSSSSTSSSSSSEPEEVLIAEYEYDARRFRIRERTYTEGVLSETRDVYFTESWQAIEERIPPQTFPWAERQYVWGTRYIDDCVLRDKLPFPGTGDPQRLYALQDANWNVVAIADDEGAVQERYAYTAYGETKFLQPDFTAQNASQFNWQTLYAGYSRNDCAGLYSVRFRSYHTSIGVWTNRDVPPYRDGLNTTRYANSNPLRFTDPTGLLLIAVDGTASRPHLQRSNLTNTGKWLSHVKNFFRDYDDGPRAYWNGPDAEYTGLDCGAISRGIFEYLQKTWCSDTTQPIDMVGHSRGGYVVMVVAQQLQKTGVRCPDGNVYHPRIRFMGLYDPVDMTPLFGESEMVPSNVDNAEVIFPGNKGYRRVLDAHGVHMEPNYPRSRPYFNRADGGPVDPRITHYHESYVIGTHAALGGAPWTGDNPGGLHSYASDRLGAIQADMIMRLAARAAGLSIPMIEDYGYPLHGP